MSAPITKYFSGWRGSGLIAITYVYFLIFAQFGFLKRLADLGIAGDQLKIIMGAMAAGGIVTSLFVARLENRWSPVNRLRAGFAGCAVGAMLTLLPVSLSTGAAVSFLIGTALGLLTVTLVTHLTLWIGTVQPFFKIGLGVGLAYFICNCPGLFAAAPAVMAIVSAGLCGLGMVLAGRTQSCPCPAPPPLRGQRLPAFWLVLACFTALVWLDSAAFYIIQHSAALKAGTWEGSRRLWQNGGVHFLAALGSSFLLARRRLSTILAGAFLLLAAACWLLTEPNRAVLAEIFYPIGVSLYSVALVAYPAYLAATPGIPERSRLAGRLYAVAGWFGSGMGIGMAEHLQRIPPAFIIGASLLFFAPQFWKGFLRRKREVLAICFLTLAAGGWQKVFRSPAHSHANGDLVNQGREVYISEGCIHCHSQYVRPVLNDEIMWGPSAEVNARRAELPPLIGNRRQGPDLTEVGNRRSALWLRMHFMNPERVSHASPMPAYAHLFSDGRGEALVAYLKSLGETKVAAHFNFAQNHWHLTDDTIITGRKLDGAARLQPYCATCHDPDGATRMTWKNSFRRMPPDFVAGPFIFATVGMPSDQRISLISRIIKFGLPGTDMPGHEYFSDVEIRAMAGQIVTRSETARDH